MEETTGSDTALDEGKDAVDHVAETISKDLVLEEGRNHSTSVEVPSYIKLGETKSVPLNSLGCKDANCYRACHGPRFPFSYTPTPVPVTRVKFDEHSDTHEIEIEGEGRVTVKYGNYQSESQMKDIMSLITKDLSEPYSIYTYRYFIHNWPKLSFLAYCGNTCVGAIVCKLDVHKKLIRRGYIAMLAVDNLYRRHHIGSNLVIKAIKMMMEEGCDEVVLETEITNVGALRLYENLGFVRDKRLFKYYLNGVDALRLKLWLK